MAGSGQVVALAGSSHTSAEVLDSLLNSVQDALGTYHSEFPLQPAMPLNRLQAALEESGDGWLTTTRLRGATWLRAGIVNYLATEDDVDRLLATLRRLADQPLDRAASRS